MEGLSQFSPSRYFRERQPIDIQKLPVTANAATDTGRAKRAPHALTYDIILGFFFWYLSLIIPPRIAEMNPRILILNAFIEANSDLNAG